MKMWNVIGSAALVLGTFSFAPSTVRAQDITEGKDAITGTMDITFNTRTNLDEKGKPRAGVTDSYTTNLTVDKRYTLNGSITRQPQILGGGVLGRGVTQASLYKFDLNLIVINPNNPAQKKTIGKWVGWMPNDEKTGVFQLDGARNADPEKDHGMRIAVDTTGSMQGFVENFAGALKGKAVEKKGLLAQTYKRVVGSKTVEITVKRSDPMTFQGLQLAGGPDKSRYPRATVNGRLDYDYETGNYFTDGITFVYTFDGKQIEDKVTGTIKWVEDAQRKSNGKGQYEFNLRFNEDKNKAPAADTAAFDKMKDEDAFFAADASIPSLTGTVEYVDTFSGETVTGSKIVYHLDANKLTRQQVMNFFKLWLVAVGPTNDE